MPTSTVQHYTSQPPPLQNSLQISFCVPGKLLKFECKLLSLLLLVVLWKAGVRLLLLKAPLGTHPWTPTPPIIGQKPVIFCVCWHIKIVQGITTSLGKTNPLYHDEIRFFRTCRRIHLLYSPQTKERIRKTRPNWGTPLPPSSMSDTDFVLGLLRRWLHRWYFLRTRIPPCRRNGLKTQFRKTSRWIRWCCHVENLQSYRIFWTLEWSPRQNCHDWNFNRFAMVFFLPQVSAAALMMIGWSMTLSNFTVDSLQRVLPRSKKEPSENGSIQLAG